jgi:hypothetical protein
MTRRHQQSPCPTSRERQRAEVGDRLGISRVRAVSDRDRTRDARIIVNDGSRLLNGDTGLPGVRILY